MHCFEDSGSSSISTAIKPMSFETVQLQNLHFIAGKEMEDNLQRITQPPLRRIS